MSASGGPARRLTWYSTNDIPSDFSPDGLEVIFSSSRTDDVDDSQFPTPRFSQLYSVNVEGGTPHQLLTTPALRSRYDAAGKRLLYEDLKGYEDPLRKHHTSSIARDLWMVELSSNTHTRLTDFAGEDREPVWAEDEDAFYFLSERSGDMNVFRQPLQAGAAAEQLTAFERHPVRHLSRSKNGDLVFSWHGDLWRMRPGAQPEQIPIEIRVDRQEPPVSMEALRRGVTEMAVSPDGQEIALVARGEVFVTSVDFSTTRRITDTPEQERSVSFSPDGRSLLYAGERGGSWNVYMTRLADDDEEYFFAATKLEEVAVAATNEEEFQPRFSPDGEEVAYLAERTILKVKNLASGRVRTVLPAQYNYSYADGDQWYEWSPDGRWFAVQFLSRGRYYSENVGLIPADGSDAPIDISNSGYNDVVPHWALKGGAVVWATDRFGQKNHGSWGGEFDVIGAFLTQDAYDRFLRSKEERELREGRKKKGDGKKGEKDEDEEEGEDGEDAEEEPERLSIEFEGIEDRTRRLTIHASDLADFALTPDGAALLYLARFEKGYDLWAHDFVEETTKLLHKLGADRAEMELTGDGKAVFVLADGSLTKIELKPGGGEDGISAGKTSNVSFSPEMNLRPDQERSYLFDHVWRQVKQKFYRADLHGVDWEFYRAQYEPKLAGIHTNRDFATLLSELLGELNASHTGGRYWIPGENPEETASLGVYFDNDYEGPGLRIVEILQKGPLAKAELQIEAPVVLTAVDGVTLDERTNLYAQLSGKTDERVRLTLVSRQGETVEKVVMPISLRTEWGLRYDRWVQQRREQVERLSDGRLGYVHVRGMNDSSFRATYSEVLGRYYDAEAIVVDTRFNGGGWLHDDLIVLLSGRRYVDFSPRNQALEEQRFYGEPGRRWWKPSIVVMCEANYSDAHFFPWAYKELGVGELVGMPVPGTATAVWWERLQTGDLLFGIPQVGMIDLDDGSYLENAQLDPDHLVNLDPESAARSEDPQIARAVEVLLSQFDRR
jgi:Tol biopolymer transport system component/C-terminal processing protease CtpA/Prc